MQGQHVDFSNEPSRRTFLSAIRSFVADRTRNSREAASIAVRRFRSQLAFAFKRPVTFNEKILYRKLYERDPRMPRLTDKITAKELVAAKLGDEWIIPTLFAGRELPPRAERLTWPLPYVVKPSHRSGQVAFVRSEADIDWQVIEDACVAWTSSLHGQADLEWAYGEIEPGIIVEEYIGSEQAPMDYKFYVFNGRVEFVEVHTDRQVEHKYAIFDRNWTRQDFKLGDLLVERRDVPAPACLPAMIDASERLGAEWSFVRVDLYEVGGRPKFGEMTFYPSSGSDRFDPPEWDRIFGELWSWPSGQKLSTLPVVSVAHEVLACLSRSSSEIRHLLEAI